MFPRLDQHEQTLGQWDWSARPLNILVAFPYAWFWKDNCNGMVPRATILDSGAWTAWRGGLDIDFDSLCEEARNPLWNEVVALDVIGNADASLKNALSMKRRGLTVMPVFHFGDPWEILQEYKLQFDRIGLASGHGAPKDQRLKWTAQCFARAYPAKFHSFGWVQKEVLLTFPFVSADTSAWATGTRFGVSKIMKGLRIPKKSEVGESNADLRFDVLEYFRLQEELEERWKFELAQFNGNK